MLMRIGMREVGERRSVRRSRRGMRGGRDGGGVWGMVAEDSTGIYRGAFG